MSILINYILGSPRDVVVNVLDCNLVVDKFERQFHDYVNFQTFTLKTGMNFLHFQAVG